MTLKKYKEFLLEWGYGGEGGHTSKDPIKIKDEMIDEIIIDDDDDDNENNQDLPILKDNVTKL